MFKHSKFKFTDPIFHDGQAWNYLKYDGHKKSIEAHIILDYRYDLNSYVAFLNIVDTDVISNFENNTLYLNFENGRCSVEISVIEKAGFFKKKKCLRSIFRFLPTGEVHTIETKMKHKVELVGDEKWDRIANFLNRVFE